MSDKTLKILSGTLSVILLLLLLVTLRDLPGGMILPGFVLGGMVLIGILLGCIVLACIAKLVIKRYSFFSLYLSAIVISFSIYYYQLYSPTLKIIVPNGYKGEISLILSNVKDNILIVDTNGIGYINQWTFNHTYTIPQIVDKNGVNLNQQCVGFNPSTFWAEGKSSSANENDKGIESLSFEIVPKDKIGQKQNYFIDLTTLANKNLIKYTSNN